MPRGAPKGNLNNLKHGFYSRAFRSQDITDLESQLAGGLQDEIIMLRVAVRRVFTYCQQEEDPEKLMTALNVLAMASARLANMLRTQKWLGSGRSQIVNNTLTSVLQEFMQEYNIR